MTNGLLIYDKNICPFPHLLGSSSSYITLQPLPSEFPYIFFVKIFFGGIFSLFFPYVIQHCFICRPSDSTVPTDAGIEPRTVATGALAVRRSKH